MLGYRSVNLQVDCKVIVSFLKDSDMSDLRHQAGILELRQLLERDWTVHVIHTYREANRVADCLAHLGHTLPFEGGSYYFAPFCWYRLYTI